jgi:AcrR family transcriptional regulator
MAPLSLPGEITLARGRKPRVGDRSAEAEDARLNILEVAAQEFADKGLAGARVDEIAEKINSSKRMIYYYFGGKEQLYRAVLEQAYAKIRSLESAANYAAMNAEDALQQYVGHTFDYHAEHPEFVRLVMNENIHYGAHIGAVPGIKERNRSVIAAIQEIIDKGAKEGRFRKGIDPIDLHMLVSALCFYNVSNRYTFAANFGVDMGLPKVAKRRREIVIETILRFCRK